jgi:hypothetical protein
LAILSDVYSRSTNSERDAFSAAVTMVHAHASEHLSALIQQVVVRSRSILVHAHKVAQVMAHASAPIPTGVRVLLQTTFITFLDQQVCYCVGGRR